MSQDADDLNWALLTRYLAGDLSPADVEVVERWFEADPRHRVLLNELRTVWAATGGETAEWNTERAVADLRRRTERAARRPASSSRGAQVERLTGARFVLARGRSWAAFAAGIAAAVTGVVGLEHLAERSRPPAASPPPATDITTRRGQQAEIRLADGSRVVLGAASHLSYEHDFGQRDRVVTLVGEAFFDVVHDSTNRFRVKTARGTAEDIGTAFVVKAHPSSALKVVVTSGAVVLRPMRDSSGARDSLFLVRGQLGSVLPNGKLARRGVDSDAYLAWTRGELVFDQTPLNEVAEELSRWYDGDVTIARSALAGRQFSGRFSRRTLEEAVRLIADVADVAVQRTASGWAFK